jgi:spectinomycin phosphotransferase
VREPPADLPLTTLRDVLATNYELLASEVAFLPIGHDAHAWVFRADTRDGASYFLKVRRRISNEAGLAIPHFLHDRGVARVVAPLATKHGTLWATSGDYALVVYPFVSGVTGMAAGMSDRQWIEYGATLRAIHEVAPSTAVELFFDEMISRRPVRPKFARSTSTSPQARSTIRADHSSPSSGSRGASSS